MISCSFGLLAYPNTFSLLVDAKRSWESLKYENNFPLNIFSQFFTNSDCCGTEKFMLRMKNICFYVYFINELLLISVQSQNYI